MGPQDTRFSVSHELVKHECSAPTPTPPTPAEKKKIIQWLHYGTSAERDEFRQNAFNPPPRILPIAPPVSNQIEVIELDCPPSPSRGPNHNRKERSTTSKTSQKRPSQSQSQLQAGAEPGESNNELKNQDNVKKRKLVQSQATPPDSGGSVQSQSDSAPSIFINFENVLEGRSQSNSVSTAEAESATKSVVQTTEDIEGMDEAVLEAVVSVQSECEDDAKVVDVEAHSGPVVTTAMEVSAVNNIESERVLDAGVYVVESEPDEVDVKAEDVKTENFKTENVKTEE